MSTSGPADAAEMEAEKYRGAAEQTLDQLQWCIDYLYAIRKRQIADALASNHRTLRERLEEIAHH